MGYKYIPFFYIVEIMIKEVIMKRICRFCGAFLATVFTASLLSPAAYAVENSSTSQGTISDLEITEYLNQSLEKDDAVYYALMFMRCSLGKDSVEVKNVYTLYDLYDNETGYYVSFVDDESDSGYVLINKFTTDDPIAEFSFEGSGALNRVYEDNVDYLDDNNLISVEAATDESSAHIIYTGPDQLFLPTEDGEYMNVYSESIVDTATINTNYEYQMKSIVSQSKELAGSSDASVDTVTAGIINWADASVDTSSVYKIPSFGAGTDYVTQSELNYDGSKPGNCVPAATTNIMLYWYWKRGHSNAIAPLSSSENSIEKLTLTRNIHKYLYSYMQTGSSGGTSDSSIVSGLTKYFGCSAQSGGMWNYKKIYSGSAYSSYKSALNDGCPVLLLMSVDTSIIGHAVYCFGYAHNTANTQNYLFVMDGSANYGRFVKFSYYGASNLIGYKIWVS
jgi:hypothetical protein